MGCVMSRKSTSSTSSMTTHCERCGPRYSSSASSSSSSSNFVRYSMEAPISSTKALSSKRILQKPEQAYSPGNSPRLGGRGGVRIHNPFTADIPLKSRNPLSEQRAVKKPIKVKAEKKTKKTESTPAEPKLEISWPTSCHRNAGLVPSAIALGYPYPYPFPLSDSPSDPDLVATVTEVEKRQDQRDVGYYGYDYECLVEAAKEGAQGGVRLEIRPGRNTVGGERGCE